MKIITYKNLIRIWSEILNKFATQEEMDELNAILEQYISRMNELEQDLQVVPSTVENIQEYVEKSLSEVYIQDLSLNEADNTLILTRSDNAIFSIPLKEN